MSIVQQLKNADAASFDQSYMHAQVEQHREVLNMLTDQLIPAAKNPDLKSQLVTTRSVVQHHLEMAMGIQQELAGQPPMH
jgi:predicted outer membrane protein